MNQESKPRSGLAITSLVLGIFSVLCFGILAGIPAIVTGHVARGRVRREPTRFGGAGVGLAGLILGYLSILETVVVVLAMLPVLGAARLQAESMQCIHNLRQIGMAVRLSATANRDVYPETAAQFSPHLGYSRFLVCPKDSALKAQNIDTKDFSRTSYILTLEGASESTPHQVIARCTVHGHTLTADGAVHSGATK